MRTHYLMIPNSCPLRLAEITLRRELRGCHVIEIVRGQHSVGIEYIKLTPAENDAEISSLHSIPVIV